MTIPTISTAPLAGLFAQVPLMRGEIHGAFVRDHLPLLLGETQAVAAHSARMTALTADAGDGEDPLPWEIDPADMVTRNGSVAVVTIAGKLCSGLSAFEAWWFGMARTEDISAALEHAATLPAAVTVLNINSPGGFTQGIPELGAEIAAYARTRPTCAFTSGQMCSAAYWLGSQASGGIYATTSAQVGCVGTYGVFYDYSKMLAERGVSVDVIAAGAFKGIGVFGTSLTREQRAFLQADVDRTNSRFLSAVKSTRAGVADGDLQGQWFDGEQAVEKKLADSVVASLGALLAELNSSLSAATA